MADVTITVALDGPEIPLPSFATAVSALNQLLKALSAEVAKESKLAWDVESLEVGSTIATVRGRVLEGDPEGTILVSEAYEAVAEALARRAVIPYSLRIRRPARQLAGLLKNHVTAVRLETPQRDFTIHAGPSEPQTRLVPAFGAVEGRIQTLSNRGSLRFTLYDTLEDHAVSCYLSPGNEDMIQQLWGQLAIVEGDIRRDSLTGRPNTIRRITAVTPIEVLGAGAWRGARGALPWDGIPAEQAVRQVRDGW
ncbi:MAG TPA: hypothetical protein VMA95_15925 [Streptosporangiaceae bacterium]|nr:hypothetical protein [Streptosporangiaceae bacterium]